METPDGFRLYERDGRLVIRRNWFSGSSYVLLAISIGILAIGYYTAIVQEKGTFGVWLLVIAAIVLTYVNLCSFINRTDVLISSEIIQVKIGPLPWRMTVSVDPIEISQVFCKRHSYSTDNRNRIEFQLVSSMKDGSEVVLIKDTQTPQKGRFFERKIEEVLGIQNMQARGEYHPDVKG